MKILHIAPEPSAAVVAARAIHEIAQNVTAESVPAPAAALHWLQDNRDTAAVVAELEALTCAAFVEQVRGLGLATPVIFVNDAARLEQAGLVLESGANGCVAAGPSLETTLPRAVAAAIESERRRRQLVSRISTEVAAEREALESPAGALDEPRIQFDQWSASTVAAVAAVFDDVETRHKASLARETRIGTALQERLLDLESALRKADDRRAAEAVSFADQLAKRHAEFTASLAQAAHARDSVAAELSVTAVALEEARQARRADAAAAAEHLRQREAELEAELARTIAGRTALEGALADEEAAHQLTRERVAGDLAIAAERQAALEDLLAHETDRRRGLDRRLAAAQAALQAADRRHAAEQAAGAEREAGLAARLTNEFEARAELERHLTIARTASAQLDDELESLRAATVEEQKAYAEREAGLAARLSREFEMRTELERHLTSARTASAQLDGELVDLRAAMADERNAHADERKAHETALAELQARYDTAVAENASVQAKHASTRAELAALRTELDSEREAHERTRAAGASEQQRMFDEYLHIRESFDRLQSSFHTLEDIAGGHAAERTRLEAVVADRDSQLSVQAERHRVAQQYAEDALKEAEERLRLMAETDAAEVARLQQEITALRRELDASRSRVEALRGVAERVPDLQTQLERSQSERRRQFERAPYALCRCSPAGAIAEANHTFVTLLGCRRVEELQNRNFVAAALDRAGDLGWLLDRARATRKTETVETQWKTRDGRRLVVRLQALATATGWIDIVAEDISGVRALEERLRQSQRMEAVGRLAPEVAGTCEALLNDVASGAREWLVKAGSDPVMRWQAERLLTDVTRAAGFMRQLGTYGDEQVRSLEPVSAKRVLRDLAPVLQRLLGEHVDLVLPRAAGSFTVDVDAERLERVLINVAGYARERIPAGGQVRIDLATTAVGRRFAAGYANVRPGDHVLITVTEVPAPDDPRASTERRRRSDKPGVDLGVLVDLIASCGGHLWMEAQPAGNMVVKIHLPKPSAASSDESRSARLTKWFRSQAADRAHA